MFVQCFVLSICMEIREIEIQIFNNLEISFNVFNVTFAFVYIKV